MEIKLLLAEAATMHPDGTFSALRAGIDRAWGPLPVLVKGAIIIRFRAATSESGSHDWKLCVLDQDGGKAAPDLQGQFQVPDQGGTAHMIISFSLAFRAYGPHVFHFVADNLKQEEWPLLIQENPMKELPK